MSEIFSYKLLLDLKNHTFKTALKIRSSEKIAEHCSQLVIKCLYINFKGVIIYIPSEERIRKYEERACIRKDFDGKNHNELAIKYKRSVQNIYSVIKKEKKPKVPELIKVINSHLPNEFIRIGLTKTEAETLALKISDYLQKKYPGISLCVSHKNYRSLNKSD